MLPRLKTLPGVVDSTLCTTVSSLRNTSVSPFLISSAVSENTLPFWLMVRSAANATLAPAMNASASPTFSDFIVVSSISA